MDIVTCEGTVDIASQPLSAGASQCQPDSSGLGQACPAQPGYGRIRR